MKCLKNGGAKSLTHELLFQKGRKSKDAKPVQSVGRWQMVVMIMNIVAY